MEPHAARSNISYHEYRVIAQLVQAHVDEHQNRFRAMVAFGGLVLPDDLWRKLNPPGESRPLSSGLRYVPSDGIPGN